MPNDINGKRVKVGDTVRRAARGSDILPQARREQYPKETVEAIGSGEHLAGLIKVRGALAWESPRNYERL